MDEHIHRSKLFRWGRLIGASHRSENANPPIFLLALVVATRAIAPSGAPQPKPPHLDSASTKMPRDRNIVTVRTTPPQSALITPI